MFAVCLLGCATLTAGAETRLLGAPNAEATAITNACAEVNVPASVDDCQRQESYQAYLEMVSEVQPEQYGVVQQCSENIERICADMLTRSAMDAQVLIPGTPLPCPGYDPSLPPPDRCPPGTPGPH
jgi:hypothetical protein